MRLNEISDNPGATHNRKRVGRGASSGLGKTSGKGQKGQKSRSGVAIKGFEGGQMPIYRRLPKRGFTNIFRKTYREVNTGRLQAAIDAGKIDAGKPIDAEVLIASGMIKTSRDGVRLLANGELKVNITIIVAGASKAAIAAVEGTGGTVTVTTVPKPAAGRKASAPAPAAAEEDAAG